jgi:hypothetical protein
MPPRYRLLRLRRTTAPPLPRNRIRWRPGGSPSPESQEPVAPRCLPLSIAMGRGLGGGVSSLTGNPLQPHQRRARCPPALAAPTRPSNINTCRNEPNSRPPPSESAHSLRATPDHAKPCPATPAPRTTTPAHTMSSIQVPTWLPLARARARGSGGEGCTVGEGGEGTCSQSLSRHSVLDTTPPRWQRRRPDEAVLIVIVNVGGAAERAASC